MARARGKKLSRIRAWVDDHAEGMFSGDREYSWDAIGGVIMFHTGIFKGTTIRYKGGNYEVRMEAVKALEKQIPKKITNMKSILDFSGRYYTTKGNCPVCNREGLYKSDFYCNKCGQKLDWGEENGR